VPAGAAPHMTIVLASDDGRRQERVTLARRGEDVYATRDGEPGAARVLTSGVGSVDTALQEIK
jgi:hypothetical protein